MLCGWGSVERMDSDKTVLTEGSEDGLDEAVMAEENSGGLEEAVMAEENPGGLEEAVMAEEIPGGLEEAVMAEENPGGLEEAVMAEENPDGLKEAGMVEETQGEHSDCASKREVVVHRDFVGLVGDARRLFCVLYGGRQQDLELIHRRYRSRQVQPNVYHFSVPGICLLNELGSMGYRVYNNLGQHMFGWLLCRSHEAKDNHVNPVPCQCFSPQETPGPQNRLLATPRRQIKTVTRIN